VSFEKYLNDIVKMSSEKAMKLCAYELAVLYQEYLKHVGRDRESECVVLK
jgi:hypothetical protein